MLQYFLQVLWVQSDPLVLLALSVRLALMILWGLLPKSLLLRLVPSQRAPLVLMVL